MAALGATAPGAAEVSAWPDGQLCLCIYKAYGASISAAMQHCDHIYPMCLPWPHFQCPTKVSVLKTSFGAWGYGLTCYIIQYYFYHFSIFTVLVCDKNQL